MLAFYRRTLGIRRDAPALRQGEFFEGRAPVGEHGLPDLVWFNASGETMSDEDWFDDGRQTLQMWIDGLDVRGHTATGEPLSDRSWLLVLHSGADPVQLTLPGTPYSTAYVPTIDTDRPTGLPASTDEIAGGSTRLMPGRTVWLLRARRPPGGRHPRLNRRQAVVTNPSSAGDASRS
jgi:glycogen operon protein